MAKIIETKEREAVREAFDGIRDVILDNSQDYIVSRQIELGKEILETNIRSA